jgi:hypothetical protein
MMVRSTHRTVHVRVGLKEEGGHPARWRIDSLVLATGDRIDAEPCYVERPARRFRDAKAALTEARRRASRAIEKRFGPIPEEHVIWEITPPDDCTESRNH